MKISVCIATYNGEKYIKEQLDSILPQLKIDDEIIISDDNSSDKTIEVVKKIKDKRIKIFINSKGQGYTKNFENALEKSSGEIIFLADQDDIWINNKVEISIKKLEKNDFVVSDCKIVDINLSILHKSHFKLREVKKGFIYNLFLTRYVGACMAFKREVLEKSLPFPSNTKLTAHDYWICLISELYFDVGLIDEPLVLYRRHGENASNGGEQSKNTLFHKLKVRGYTLFNLLKAYKR